jgi:threonine aldolase
LAEGLANIPGIEFPLGYPQSNMVFVQLSQNIPFNAGEIASRLLTHGIKVGVTGPRMFRMVLHYWVDDSGVERTLKAFQTGL